jgi:hypothetical protein
MVRDEQIRLERSKAGLLGGRPRTKQIKSKPKAKVKQSLEDEYEKEVEVKHTTVGVGKGGRPPNLLWDAVVAEWNLPVATKTQRGRVGAVVSEFAGAGATPSEIPIRRKAIAAAWGPEKATPESVAKHWGEFKPGTVPEDVAEKRRRIREAESAAYLRQVHESDALVRAQRAAKAAREGQA